MGLPVEKLQGSKPSPPKPDSPKDSTLPVSKVPSYEVHGLSAWLKQTSWLPKEHISHFESYLVLDDAFL